MNVEPTANTSSRHYLSSLPSNQCLSHQDHLQQRTCKICQRNTSPFATITYSPPRVTRHWGRSQPTWRTPPRVLTCSTCLSNTLALSAQYGVSKECATPQTWSSYMVESPFANTRDSKTTPAGGDEDVMVNTLYLSCAYKPILPHTQQVEVTRRLTNTEISPPSSANPSSSLISTNRIWPKPSPPCPTNLS